MAGTHKKLWLTEISRATYDDQNLDSLGGDGGLFLVLEDEIGGRFDVIAKVPAGRAALMLMDLLPDLLVENG